MQMVVAIVWGGR